MSGTQPTMADAHPPGAQVFKLPVDPPRPGIECGIGDSESDSEDDKPLKRSKSPIKKPKALKPTPLMLTPLKFAERQYSCKLDEDGVWRYRPEDGDFKGHKSLSPSPRVEGPPSPVPVTPYANKRESPDEWPEDEAKLKMPKAPRKSKTPKSKFKGKSAMKAKRSLKKGIDKAMD